MKPIEPGCLAIITWAELAEWHVGKSVTVGPPSRLGGCSCESPRKFEVFGIEDGATRCACKLMRIDGDPDGIQQEEMAKCL